MSDVVNDVVKEDKVEVIQGEVATVPVSINLSGDIIKSLESNGMIVGDIGTKISRVPIEKYKASTQKIDRIGFITKSVIGVKFHYIEGAGSIVCFGKKCCEMSGIPQVRYLFPVVVYSTDNEGEIIGKKIELKILSAGDDLYKSIITISRGLNSMGGIDNADMLVTCTDDKYQKITLSPVGKASWRQSPSIVQMVTEKWSQDAEYAYMALARKVDEDAFLKLMGLDSQESSNLGSFNSSANQDLSKFFED